MSSLSSFRRMTKRPYRRIGRGQSSSRGKQSGRGGKGQTARAGHKVRPAWRDIIKKLPKRRGFGKNRAKTVNAMREHTISLSTEKLTKLFPSGGEVTLKTLMERNIVRGRGPRPIVKIVGGNVISARYFLKGIKASMSARSMIEKAGGTVTA